MEMLKPGPEHAKLARIAGLWLGKDTMQPSPFSPSGDTVDARVENRVALGGFVVVQDYAQLKDGQPTFEGHAVFSWDKPRNVTSCTGSIP